MTFRRVIVQILLVLVLLYCLGALMGIAYWAPPPLNRLGLTSHDYSAWRTGQMGAYSYALDKIDCSGGCIGNDVPPGDYGENQSKRLINCNEAGVPVTASISRFGTRKSTINGPVKYVAVGDSFVFGICVEDSHTIPAQLERLTGARVVNLGFSGFNIRNYTRIVRYAYQLEPELRGLRTLVFLYEGNDYEPEGGEWVPITKEFYKSRIRYSSRDFYRPPRADLSTIFRYHIAEYMEPITGFLNHYSGGSTIFDEHQIEAELLNLISVIGADNLTMYMIPSITSASEIFMNTKIRRNEKFYALVEGMAKKHGFEFYDLRPVLRAEADPRGLFQGRTISHYTSDGYAKLAALVHERLKNGHRDLER